jgi:hypothetical protein
VNEAVRLDQAHIIALYAELGQINAEAFLACAMEDIAVHIATVASAATTHSPEELLRAVRAIEMLSRPVGLEAVARVARDVITCFEANDPIALSATVQRLLRIGDHSLPAIWDGADLSG